MNCKPGDLAVVVGAFNNTKFIGCIVRCKKSFFNVKRGEYGWQVDRNLGGYVGIADKHLKPIRDNDGEDESLTWAGKPLNLELTT